MKLFRKVSSVLLATAMAIGVTFAPVTVQLAGIPAPQSVAYAAAHNVTKLPAPDAQGQGGGPTAGLIFIMTGTVQFVTETPMFRPMQCSCWHSVRT